MSQVQQELRNWTGGALNIIRLIGKSPIFATLCSINCPGTLNCKIWKNRWKSATYFGVGPHKSPNVLV